MPDLPRGARGAGCVPVPRAPRPGSVLQSAAEGAGVVLFRRQGGFTFEVLMLQTPALRYKRLKTFQHIPRRQNISPEPPKKPCQWNTVMSTLPSVRPRFAHF